jgi:hypothetical protein
MEGGHAIGLGGIHVGVFAQQSVNGFMIGFFDGVGQGRATNGGRAAQGAKEQRCE